MATPVFFSQAWADAVRDAVDRCPDDEARRGKLDDYWKWVDGARAEYSESWALGVRDLPTDGGRSPAYLVLRWSLGRCVDARIAGPDGLSAATYVLAGDYAAWCELLGGYDAGRLVMYRKILLEDGPLLPFFRIIYFFVECLGCLARVPVILPR